MHSESSKYPQYRVLADYEVTDPRPLILGVGAEVALVRKDPAWPGWVWVECGADHGWIPENFLADTAGATTTTIKPFNGRDLSAHKGALLSARDSAPGWIYAMDADEQTGWFPLFNLKPVE